MTSEPTFDSDSAADLRAVRVREATSRIRAALTEPFIWPPSLMRLTTPLRDLSAVMDVGRLADMAAAISDTEEIVFTLISREYIETGLNWISAMRTLGMTNFLVIAGDEFTAKTLDDRKVPCVQAEIDDTEFDPSFVSHDGFSAKGLAMIALKFPVSRFLLRHGFSVVFSDADAVWLQNPMSYLRGTDIAFQRVAHHPSQISSLWSFSACTGFVYFRNSDKTISFLDRCIQAHQSFRCDQVAMNIALLEGDPEWICDDADWKASAADVGYGLDERLTLFTKLAQFPIRGALKPDRLQILALPHDKFWRHLSITPSVPDMVICHPNSPKDDLEKMKIFDSMGVRFRP
jgi:hypothetical protein